MSRPIIEVRDLAKRYRLGSFGARSLRDEAEMLWRRLRRKNRLPAVNGNVSSQGIATGSRHDETEFWALREISFSVQAGEVLGIIGRNGAGKSTLLKILSRITEPTDGEIVMRGRIASLLEVGTGFHPELSGRENIYLNGAILGMKKEEINRRFDEIVDFAEVGTFIDTPVKRYSSGMYVRLAFAVAAHLEPDILVVDEVLAVGDQSFQEKCLGKMRDVSRGQGRTVIFVSHNLAAISSLTDRCIYLKAGRLEQAGATSQVLNHYLSETFLQGASWSAPRATNHPLQVVAVSILDMAGNRTSEIEACEGCEIELEYEVRGHIRQGLIEIYIFTSDGTHLITLGEHDAKPSVLNGRETGLYRTRVRIPGNLLNVGRYLIRINAAHGTMQTYDLEDTVAFRIVETRQRTAREGRRGHVISLIPWQTELVGKEVA